MSRVLVAMLLALLCLLYAPAARAVPWAQEPIPDIVVQEQFGVTSLRWVSAERIFTPSGDIDSGLFSPATIRSIRAQLSLPEKDGCIQLGSYIIDLFNPPRRADVEEAAALAELVLIGRVTALAPGFVGPEAGHLIKIIPVEFVKGGKEENSSFYYVFMPVGSFRVGGKRICKSDPRYPNLPEIGERLVLFAPVRDPNGSPFLQTIDDGGIVVLHSTSAVSLPQRYKADPLVRDLKAEKFIEMVHDFSRRVVERHIP